MVRNASSEIRAGKMLRRALGAGTPIALNSAACSGLMGSRVRTDTSNNGVVGSAAVFESNADSAASNLGELTLYRCHRSKAEQPETPFRIVGTGRLARNARMVSQCGLYASGR